MSERKHENKFDFVVIGGGSGGLAAARRAAEYGARVAIIEQGRLGGTCVNVGCVPKKIMFNVATLAEQLHTAHEMGFALQNVPRVDWGLMKQKRDAFVLRLNGIYQTLLDSSKVTTLRGKAKFLGPHSLEVVSEEKDSEVVQGKHVLIATGGRPLVPNIRGKEHILTSDDFFTLTEQPSRVAIVGAGYIAVELAGILNALGTKTSLVVRGNTALRAFDSMVATNLHEQMQEQGIEVVPQTVVSAVEKEGDGSFTLVTSANKKLVGFDRVLYAIGRRPNTDFLNMAVNGAELDPRGHLVVDEWQNTTVKGVYALGDVAGKALLTPVAIAAGRKLAARLFNGEKEAKLDYDTIPTVVFSHPPIGTVGLSQEQAVKQFGEEDVRVYSSSFRDLSTALHSRRPKTFIKVVCVKSQAERVVGLHVLGGGADELLQGFAVCMKMGATKADLDSCVAIHPTVAEEVVTLR